MLGRAVGIDQGVVARMALELEGRVPDAEPLGQHVLELVAPLLGLVQRDLAGQHHVGGRIWRYELEPVDGGTKVSESWDIRHESVFTKPVVRMSGGKTGENMAATLERIEQVVTA